ncbi:hypothetical protein ACOSP6_07870 [Tenacibaculum sp. MEBiC06402]|uniref:hypothetical protein n=1 Tax=unclassified Tenacibaculum TaxID=2635139 RepID=UPI003B9B3173
MKNTFLIVLLTIFVSCSNNDSIIDVITKELYVSKIVNTSANGSSELRFTYDSKNRLIKNETDAYYREFIYNSNNKVVTIKSVTKPNIPYYTVNFVYDNLGRIIEVKRDNHYNSSIFYTKYDYYATGEVDNVYVFTSMDNYNSNNHNRYYDVSGYGSGNNFEGKLLSVYNSNNDFYDPLDDETWSYDSYYKPYFGEAINEIALPYATDGTGIDWDVRYQSNNPVNVSTFNFNSGINFIRRSYEYIYNDDGYPTKMVKKTYLPDGSVSATFTQDYTYELR